MQAFHNDQAIKDKYLNRVLEHQKTDEIIKGVYWQKGKGCAVGCTIHDSDHSKYETELGIPRWMARLEDRIFEGLPNERAMLWPVEFLNAVNVGSDLSKCLRPMLIFIVEFAKELAKSEKSKEVCEGVLIELRKEVSDIKLLRKDASASAVDAATYASAYTYTVSAVAASAFAARKDCYAKFADELLRLIRECK